MVNGLHLYSAFIQSTLQFIALIHPSTHQRRLAAMQGINQLVRSNWGLGVLLRDTSTCPGWDRTSNPPTARGLLLLPDPHRVVYTQLANVLAVGQCVNRYGSVSAVGQSVSGRAVSKQSDTVFAVRQCVN